MKLDGLLIIKESYQLYEKGKHTCRAYQIARTIFSTYFHTNLNENYKKNTISVGSN